MEGLKQNAGCSLRIASPALRARNDRNICLKRSARGTELSKITVIAVDVK